MEDDLFEPFFDQRITKERLLSELNSVWFDRIPNLDKKAYWNSIVAGINKSIMKGCVVIPHFKYIFGST